LAQESDDGGRVLNVLGEPMADTEIATECGVSLETWQAARNYFARVRTSRGDSYMLTEVAGAVCVTNLRKRQAPDATHAERQARYRSKSASRDASRDASKRDEKTDRQTDRGQKTEDRGQRIEDRKRAQTPPPPVNGNGAHKDTEAAVSGGGGAGEFDAQLNPERFVAASYVKLVAPDFRGLGSFITETNCKLVGWCTLHVGAAIAANQEIDNPAGLIRTLVKAGSYPDMPGYLRDKWAADVQAARNGEYAEDTNVPY